MTAEQTITNGELIRLAAVCATMVSIVVTIILFALRELMERNRLRKRSAKLLAMYAQITKRSLTRNSKLELPFTMKDMITNCEPVLDCDSALTLFSDIEASLFEINSLEKIGQAMTSLQRTNLVSEIDDSLANHVLKFRLKLNFC